jgi:hypothetical protein
MACLLYACYQTLSSRGMTGMFVDGVSYGHQVLVSLGEFRRTDQERRCIAS